MGLFVRVVLLLLLPVILFACPHRRGAEHDAAPPDAIAEDAAPPDAGGDGAVPTCSASSIVEQPVAVIPGEQVVPNIAASASGDVWVSWYDNARGNYDVRIQRLSPEGEPELDATGLLVSEHPSDTWVTDYSLAVDREGAAIVAFNDIRTGHFEPFAYRVDPSGQMLWGADGIALSPHAADGMFPKIALTTSGEAVFVFERFDDNQNLHEAVLQRIALDGTVRWDSGVVITSASSELVVRPWIAASDSDAIIVVWLEAPDIMSYDRTLYARKLGPDGDALWATDVVISVGGEIPFFYDPVLEPDGQGGLFVAWQEIIGSRTAAMLQHLDAQGNTSMTSGGVPLSTSSSTMQLRLALAFVAPAGELIAVWRETDLSQTVYGISAQRFTPDGTRGWADAGLVLEPASEVVVDLAGARAHDDTAVVVFGDWPFGGNASSRVRAGALHLVSSPNWNPVDLAPSENEKGHVNVAPAMTCDGLWSVWEALGQDLGDIFAGYYRIP